jgi:hypothetical protein
MFDQVITFRHAELRRAWEAIYAAERAVEEARRQGRDVSGAERLLRQARASARLVPVSEATAMEIAQQVDRDPTYRAAKEREWEALARDAYGRALQLANQAAQVARGR